MIRKPLDQITGADVVALVEAGTLEGKTLEYKERLYAFSKARDEGQEKLRQEAMRDVTALANAEGGDMVFGISDAVELVGLRPEDDPDGFMDRLVNIIGSNVYPKLAGIRHRLVDCGDGKRVLIVRVPKSLTAPHMVGETSNSFWSREATGKRQMDVHELRNAFTMSAVLAERLREERTKRLNLILSDAAPVQLLDDAKLVLHVFPLVALAGRGTNLSSPQIADLNRDLRLKCLHMIRGGGMDWRPNFDGLLTYRETGRGKPYAYTQLFRSGAIEAVSSLFFSPSEQGGAFYPNYEIEVAESAAGYLDLLLSLEINPPYLLTLSFLNVRGYSMPYDSGFMVRHAIDKDHLLMPDVEVDTWPGDIHAVLHPVFDNVWQAIGLTGSANYDEEGRWAPPRR